MSILFPKTWTAEKLQAQDVRNNLDAMQEKQHKLGSLDFQLATAWIDTHHIMQGRYSSTENLATNVSGVFGGRNNGAFFNRTSYCTRWISKGTGGNTRKIYIPYTNITFDILRPCTLFFQWHMIHQSKTDGDGTTGTTLLHTALNDEQVVGNGIDHIVAEQPSGSAHNVLVDGTRTTNGFILQDISSQVKEYSIGLTGQSSVGKCMNVSWSVSLECFYM